MSNKNITKILNAYANLSPWIRVIRLPLAFLGILASVSLLLYVDILFTLKGLFLLLSLSLINIGFNVLNELKDIEDDKINKSWRPLPQNEISIPAVKRFIFLSFAVGAAFLSLLFTYHYLYLFVGIVGIAGAFIYNVVSRTWGNIGAFMSYSTAVYLASDLHFLLFSFAFGAYVLAFNIGVQVQDAKYDTKKTIPKVLGTKRATSLIVAMGALSILLFLMSFPIFALPAILSALGAFVFIAGGDEQIFEITNRFLSRIFLIFCFFYILIVAIM